MDRPKLNVWEFLQEMDAAAKQLLPVRVRDRLKTAQLENLTMVNEVGLSPYLPADFDCADVPSDYGLLWETCSYKGGDNHLSIYVDHSGLFLRITLGNGVKLMNVELASDDRQFSVTNRLITAHRGRWINVNQGGLTDDLLSNTTMTKWQGMVWSDGPTIFFKDGQYASLWVLCA